MSDFDWDDEDNFGDAQNQSNVMKELRKAYKEAQ